MIIALTGGRGPGYKQVIDRIKAKTEKPVFVEYLKQLSLESVTPTRRQRVMGDLKSKYTDIAANKYVLVLVFSNNHFGEHDWLAQYNGEVWHVSISTLVAFDSTNHRFVSPRLTANNCLPNKKNKVAPAFMCVEWAFEEAELRQVKPKTAITNSYQTLKYAG